MLNREECENKLNNLKKLQKEINKNCKLNSVANSVFIGSLECFEYLIKEQFDNPPLKWEELNKGYPIYDNDEIVCGWKFIYMIDKEYKQLLLIDEEGNVDWVNYEENRFYRKEVQE